MNNWTIKFDTIIDFNTLGNLLVGSDLIDLKSAKVISIEVNEFQNCCHCFKLGNYKFNISYKNKIYYRYLCYFCIIDAYENYLNRLIDFVEKQAFELKKQNIKFKH